MGNAAFTLKIQNKKKLVFNFSIQLNAKPKYRFRVLLKSEKKNLLGRDFVDFGLYHTEVLVDLRFVRFIHLGQREQSDHSCKTKINDYYTNDIFNF